MTDKRTKELAEDLAYGEGVEYFLENGWLDVDVIQDQTFKSWAIIAYKALDYYKVICKRLREEAERIANES